MIFLLGKELRHRILTLLMIAVVLGMCAGSLTFSNIGIPVNAFTEGPTATMEAFQWNTQQISSVLFCRNQTYNGPYDDAHPKYSFIQPWNPNQGEITVEQKCAVGGTGILGGYPDTAYGTVIVRLRVDPDTSVAAQPVSYDITAPNGTIQRVTGQVVAYKLYLEIYIQSNANSAASFSGQSFSSVVPVLSNIAFWFNVGTQLWDNCIDPATGTTSTNAWNIPLSLYLNTINTFAGGSTDNPDNLQPWSTNSAGHTNQPFYPSNQMVQDCVKLIEPTNPGDTWTLYRTPNTQGQLTDQWSTTANYATVNMNESLATSTYNISPIKNFQGNWWFRVAFSLFRPNLEKNELNQVEATDFPSIGLIGRLWYLQLGTFVYQQGSQDKPAWTWQGWQQVFGPAHYLWGDIFAAIGMLNPFNIFGPFQGLVETLFLIFCFGFVLWCGFELFGDLTGFHVSDYIHDLIYPAKVIYRNRPRRKNKS